ncbi:META domain-containing protein [Deinococcus peraridilitoris]|uniref:Heat shock protein n=1 Tax=Deinococcus peraridilitoris (strain DSM 19664 / LMG 22246 / CIP 109416 / KR-200) TaxID=937777 RepID=L0A7Q1_DEIPD|nr:META domain-containing protein [Deinococcus peraridilitoris]AFZ69197.1 heat shock protein [Deinococcus peraridilitoris DSM 19664]
MARMSSLFSILPSFRLPRPLRLRPLRLASVPGGDLARAAVALLVLSTVGEVHAQRITFGTVWTLYRYGQASQEVTVSTRNAPTLQFDVGRALGHAGCNSFSAGYIARGRELKIGSLTASKLSCSDQRTRELEQYFLQALTNVKRYQLNGDFLVLFTGDRDTLVFTRSQ